jgi:hypothetical protein
MFYGLVKSSRFTLCNNLFDELTILNCLDMGMVPRPADRDCYRKKLRRIYRFSRFAVHNATQRIDSLEREPTPANAVAESLQRGRF